MRVRHGFGAAVGILAALGFATVLAAATITNGSFEGGLTGWSASAVNWVCGWQAADGNCSIDLDSEAAQGSVSQGITTVPGATYTVAFSLSGNPQCTAGNPAQIASAESTIKTLTVSATGGAPASYTFDTSSNSLSNMGWTPQTYSFTATGTVSTLSFQSGNWGWCGAMIDAVSISGGPVANVPTSADQCKKGGWQTLTDDLGNKFKNQGDCVSYVATGGKNKGAIAP